MQLFAALGHQQVPGCKRQRTFQLRARRSVYDAADPFAYAGVGFSSADRMSLPAELTSGERSLLIEHPEARQKQLAVELEEL